MSDMVKVQVIHGIVTGDGVDGGVVDAGVGESLMVREQSLEPLKDKVTRVVDAPKKFESKKHD